MLVSGAQGSAFLETAQVLLQQMVCGPHWETPHHPLGHQGLLYRGHQQGKPAPFPTVAIHFFLLLCVTLGALSPMLGSGAAFQLKLLSTWHLLWRDLMNSIELAVLFRTAM